MFAILVIMLLIMAIINYIKKKEHDDEMKMTKQEVKEENKAKDVDQNEVLKGKRQWSCCLVRT